MRSFPREASSRVFFTKEEESNNNEHVSFWSKNFQNVVVKKIDELLKKDPKQKVELHLFFSEQEKLEGAGKKAWDDLVKRGGGPFYYSNWNKLVDK